MHGWRRRASCAPPSACAWRANPHPHPHPNPKHNPSPHPKHDPSPDQVRLEAEAAGLAERLGSEESARAELVREGEALLARLEASQAEGRYSETQGDIGEIQARLEASQAEAPSPNPRP